jgi:hypothetical protein
MPYFGKEDMALAESFVDGHDIRIWNYMLS